MPRRSRLLWVVVAALAAGPAYAGDAADFYRGRTITVLMGTSPGGSYDLYARILIDHMRQYIPGKPKMLPSYMRGEDGAKAANYIYNTAPQDGTWMLSTHSVPLIEMLRPKAAKFESRKFKWLGAFSQDSQVLAIWHGAPVRSLDDAKKRPVVIGAFSRRHSTFRWPMLMNAALGTRFGVVTGYRDAAKLNAAMEAREIDGWAASWQKLSAVKARWLKDGKVTLLVQFAAKPIAGLPKVPMLQDLVSADHRRVVEFLTAGMPIARALAMGPGVPDHLVAAMRVALAKTLKDPAYLTEARKRRLPVTPWSAKQIEALVETIVGASPDLVADVKRSIGAD